MEYGDRLLDRIHLAIPRTIGIKECKLNLIIDTGEDVIMHIFSMDLRLDVTEMLANVNMEIDFIIQQFTHDLICRVVHEENGYELVVTCTDRLEYPEDADVEVYSIECL